jgi:DNA repair exonuclease SbcCD ATPase subunit
MSFTRHVGKHGDRKVAVVFREVPGEPHMCLVTYTETINKNIHDALIKCIESDIGQNSENLADALNRSYTQDGRPILQVLHAESQLKKVNTEVIVMTPAPNTRIKLNDLNKILDEMKLGEDAVKRMAELDKSRGLQDPADVARRMRGQQGNQPPVVASSGDLLGDASLAKQRIEQAQKMEREAKGLLAEAQRLTTEAQTLDPSLAPKATKAKTKKAEVITEVAAPAKRKYTKKVTNVA